MTSYANRMDVVNEKFNVVQFFEDGTHEYVRRQVSALDAVQACEHYTKSVAARMGMVKQVIITNMLDETVFDWRYSQGIVFPTRVQLAELKEKEK